MYNVLTLTGHGYLTYFHFRHFICSYACRYVNETSVWTLLSFLEYIYIISDVVFIPSAVYVYAFSILCTGFLVFAQVVSPGTEQALPVLIHRLFDMVVYIYWRWGFVSTVCHALRCSLMEQQPLYYTSLVLIMLRRSQASSG